MKWQLHEILVKNATGYGEILHALHENKKLAEENRSVSMILILGAFQEDVRILGEGTPDRELDFVIYKLGGIEFTDEVLTSSIKKLVERRVALDTSQKIEYEERN